MGLDNWLLHRWVLITLLKNFLIRYCCCVTATKLNLTSKFLRERSIPSKGNYRFYSDQYRSHKASSSISQTLSTTTCFIIISSFSIPLTIDYYFPFETSSHTIRIINNSFFFFSVVRLKATITKKKCNNSLDQP